MNQNSEIRKPGTVTARRAHDEMLAKPIAVIAEADLDKVSGGGGASGGVLGDRQWK